MAAPATKKTTPTKAPISFSVEMDFTKSTKGTHVYSNDGEGVPVTTLYVKRAAFTGEPPAQITLTVEVSG